MKIGSIAIETDTLECERPLYGISIVAALNDGVNTSLDSSPHNAANLIGSLDSKCTVSIHIEDKNGNKHRMCTNKPLTMLMDLAQSGEGSVVIHSGTLRAFIPLTDSGVLEFLDDQKLVISCTNQSGLFDSIDFYSMDFPKIATEYKAYNYLEVQDRTEKTFNIRQYTKLMFKVSEISASTELELSYANGAKCSYKLNEIISMGLLVNDASYVVNGYVNTGWGIYAIIDVSACTELKIERLSTQAFNIVGVQQNLYGNILKAMKKSELRDVATQESQMRGNASVAG